MQTIEYRTPDGRGGQVLACMVKRVQRVAEGSDRARVQTLDLEEFEIDEYDAFVSQLESWPQPDGWPPCFNLRVTAVHPLAQIDEAGIKALAREALVESEIVKSLEQLIAEARENIAEHREAIDAIRAFNRMLEFEAAESCGRTIDIVIEGSES